MQKVKLIDVLNLNSPILNDIFTGSSRVFKVKDAHELLKLAREGNKHIEVYKETLKKLMAQHDVKFNATLTDVIGENKEAFNKDLKELQDTEVELNCDKLSITDDWPALTIAELSLLDPFT